MRQDCEEDEESHSQYSKEDEVADVDPEYCVVSESTVCGTKDGCPKTNVCH